jgi:hypothetical protein
MITAEHHSRIYVALRREWNSSTTWVYLWNPLSLLFFHYLTLYSTQIDRILFLEVNLRDLFVLNKYYCFTTIFNYFILVPQKLLL